MMQKKKEVTCQIRFCTEQPTWIIPIEMGLIRIQTSSEKLLLQSETPRQKSEGITPDFCCGFLNRFF